MLNYFVDHPVYPERYFLRQFRMSIDLFKHIAECLKLHDHFFEQRSYARVLRHSTYQKVTEALRIMAYRIPANLVGDRLAMGEKQTIKCVQLFFVAIIEVF
jgi:hypothetical protein